MLLAIAPGGVPVSNESIELMSRMLVTVIVVLIVLVGGLFLLSNRAHEKPQTRVEKAVSLANLQG